MRIEHVIAKHRPIWIKSWMNNPLSDLETDGWHPYKSEYSYSYTKIPEYESFYFYSPSRKMYVDIYSRTMDIDVNGNDTSLTYLEPESEIILSDTIFKTSIRLLFVSDGTYFEDVIWTTDSCFIVLGYSIVEDKIASEILIFDVEKKQRIEYKGAVNKRIFDYLEKKFSGFDFVADSGSVDIELAKKIFGFYPKYVNYDFPQKDENTKFYPRYYAPYLSK
jgi:hypothetical protein